MGRQLLALDADAGTPIAMGNLLFRQSEAFPFRSDTYVPRRTFRASSRQAAASPQVCGAARRTPACKDQPWIALLTAEEVAPQLGVRPAMGMGVGPRRSDTARAARALPPLSRVGHRGLGLRARGEQSITHALAGRAIRRKVESRPAPPPSRRLHRTSPPTPSLRLDIRHRPKLDPKWTLE